MTRHGTMAEFRSAQAVEAAVEAARAAGATRLDVFAPFPLRDLAVSLGWHPGALPWIAAGAGAVGAVSGYALQWWTNAVDYPLNVGGRPLHAWPTFLPGTIILAILAAGAATLLATLLILRLPRLDHPVFAVPGFERASQDRFFLLIHADDPAVPPPQAERLLAGLAPVRVQPVPGKPEPVPA